MANQEVPFAIEVAEKMGIPPAILNKAKGKKSGREAECNYDKLLNQLGKEKRELETKIKGNSEIWGREGAP